MSLVDSVILAHNDAIHLGLQSIGDAPISLIMLVMNGLVMGVLFVASAAYEKKDYEAVGASFRQALQQSLLLGLVAIPVVIFAPEILALFDYTPEHIAIASKVMRILGSALPFSILYFTCMFFINAVKESWINTRLIIIANLLNLFLDWLLIGGNLGFPRLLSVGAAITTATVRTFLALSLLSIILFHPKFKKLKILSRKKLVKNSAQYKIGISSTANMLCAESGFAFCLFFAGTISMMTAAAYTLSYRIIILNQLISASLAVVGTILINQAKSSQSAKRVQYNTAEIIRTNNFVQACCCALLLLFSKPLLDVLTNDSELRNLSLPIFQIAVLVMFARGLNSIQIILLRAFHDLLIPSILYGLCLTLLMPLFCWFFGGVLNWEGNGIMFALLLGNTVAAVVLGFRLQGHIRQQDTISLAARAKMYINNI